MICLNAVIAVVAAGAVGNDQALTLIAAICICALGFFAQRLFSNVQDYALVVGLIGQTALITAAFTGHAWQLDSHMMFYAALAMLVLLVNPIALMVGAGLIILHHAALSFTLPALVYPSSEMLPALYRTAFHGLVVVLEASVLVWSIHTRLRMIAISVANEKQVREAATAVEMAMDTAEEARAAAIASQERAEQEATRAQDALKEANEQSERTRRAHAATRQAEEEHAAIQKKANDELQSVIRELSDALARLAAKKLDLQLQDTFPTDYEALRTDYNSAVASLNDAITSVATQVQKIRENAAAIAETSRDQSARSEARSRALAEVSNSVRDLEASVAMVAGNASEASETVKNSNHHADEGMQVVDQAVSAMYEIEGSANEIRKIVSLIEDISFQTNLLSLNAGVEAARAGEAGRGFAVVATEVRALAQRSSDSANEIKSLISKSDQQVKNGVALVQQSGAALKQILSSVGSTNNQVDGINESVHQQNRRLTVIAETLEKLSTSARRDSTMIEETATASATLNEATDILSDAISVFKTDTAATRQDPSSEDERAA